MPWPLNWNGPFSCFGSFRGHSLPGPLTLHPPVLNTLTSVFGLLDSVGGLSVSDSPFCLPFLSIHIPHLSLSWNCLGCSGTSVIRQVRLKHSWGFQPDLLCDFSLLLCLLSWGEAGHTLMFTEVCLPWNVHLCSLVAAPPFSFSSILVGCEPEPYKCIFIPSHREFKFVSSILEVWNFF